MLVVNLLCRTAQMLSNHQPRQRIDLKAFYHVRKLSNKLTRIWHSASDNSNRVTLKPISALPGSDYINASRIDVSFYNSSKDNEILN